MAKKSEASYYLIQYRDPKDAKIVELKAKRIEDSNLGLSFVRISDFVFDLGGTLVQPSEVQLQQRLEDVRSLHLSIYSIVSVEERGSKVPALKFKKSRSNLISFPGDNPSPK